MEVNYIFVSSYLLSKAKSDKLQLLFFCLTALCFNQLNQWGQILNGRDKF